MYKILYITYDGLTDPLGESQILPYLKGLSTLNYQIIIVSLEKKERFKNKEHIVKEEIKNYNIIWYPLKYSSCFYLLSALGNFLKVIARAFYICRIQQINLIHARSYPSAIISLLLKKICKLQYIFDIRGFWIDERIEGKIWNKRNLFFYLIFKFLKLIEKKLFSNAIYIVTLTEKAKEIILSWNFLHKPKIEVIPCCVDLEHFNYRNLSEISINNLKSSLHLSNENFILSYIGSIGSWYMVEEMLDFFILLKRKKQNAKFLFITLEKSSIISEIVRKKNINYNDIIVLSALRREVPLYLSLSDVSIFFIKPVFSKSASSPTKMGEILALGIPIIVNTSIGDVEKIVKETNCGILVDKFTFEAYEEAIDKIEEIIKFGRDHFRNVAKRFFSLEDGIEKYKKIYQMSLRG